MKSTFPTFLSLTGLALGLYAGCSQASDEAPIDDACEAIIDACHTKDDGSVQAINDCHTVGHDGVDADCQAQHDDCVALCGAAPEVGNHDDGQTDGGHDDAATDDAPSTSGSADDDGTTTTADAGTTGTDSTGSTDGTDSTGADDASNANCADLGSGCHDVPGRIPQMCHDVGHDGDEMACAQIWEQCVEACGL